MCRHPAAILRERTQLRMQWNQQRADLCPRWIRRAKFRVVRSKKTIAQVGPGDGKIGIHAAGKIISQDRVLDCRKADDQIAHHPAASCTSLKTIRAGRSATSSDTTHTAYDRIGHNRVARERRDQSRNRPAACRAAVPSRATRAIERIPAAPASTTARSISGERHVLESAIGSVQFVYRPALAIAAQTTVAAGFRNRRIKIRAAAPALSSDRAIAGKRAIDHIDRTRRVKRSALGQTSVAASSRCKHCARRIVPARPAASSLDRVAGDPAIRNIKTVTVRIVEDGAPKRVATRPAIQSRRRGIRTVHPGHIAVRHRHSGEKHRIAAGDKQTIHVLPIRPPVDPARVQARKECAEW